MTDLCQFLLLGHLPLWQAICRLLNSHHDDRFTWKHFPHFFPIVRGLVNSSHCWIPLTKGKLLRALIFALLLAWTSCWTKLTLCNLCLTNSVAKDTSVCSIKDLFKPREGSYILMTSWLNSLLNAPVPLSRMLSANQYELAFVVHRTAPYWFELLRIRSLPLSY